MRTLLSKAIKKIENMPKELQDEISKQILEDVEDELKWQAALAQPFSIKLLKTLI
jgi:hypothetical protein